MKNTGRAEGLRIWFIAVLFYCFAIAIRGIFSAANENIMAEFDVTYTKIGYLKAGLMVAYGLFSVVSGFFIESYGARRVLLIASLAISFSGFIIFKSQLFFMVSIAYAILGVPVSTGWPAVGYCVNKYFSKDLMSLMFSFSMAAAALGSGIGNFLSRFLINISGDWRDIPYLIFVAGLLFFLIIKFFFHSKEKKANKPEDTNDSYPIKDIISNLKLLLRKKTLWSICFIAAALYSPMVIWGDNYGQSYIKNVLCSNSYQSSFIPPLIYVGFVCGNFLATYIARNVVKSEFITLFINNIASLFVSIVLIVSGISNIYLFSALMFLMGVSMGGQILIFSIIGSLIKYKTPALSVGIINSLMMLFVSGSVYLFGVIIDFLWDGKYDGAMPAYTCGNYQGAMSINALFLFIALIVCIWIYFSKTLEKESDPNN